MLVRLKRDIRQSLTRAWQNGGRESDIYRFPVNLLSAIMMNEYAMTPGVANIVFIDYPLCLCNHYELWVIPTDDPLFYKINDTRLRYLHLHGHQIAVNHCEIISDAYCPFPEPTLIQQITSIDPRLFEL